MENKELVDNVRSDYLAGTSITHISKRHGVSRVTIYDWIKKYSWDKQIDVLGGAGRLEQIKVSTINTEELENNIKVDLIDQLKAKGNTGKYFMDLVDDYINLWRIKNSLVNDITIRGVMVKWSNGKQYSYKKNDSVTELVKYNAQMLKLLSELGLKANVKVDDTNEYEL